MGEVSSSCAPCRSGSAEEEEDKKLEVINSDYLTSEAGPLIRLVDLGELAPTTIPSDATFAKDVHLQKNNEINCFHF